MSASADLSSIPTFAPVTGAERQELIDHAGRIDKKAFQVSHHTLIYAIPPLTEISSGGCRGLGVAVIFAVLRGILRLKIRHRLFLDDYLVTFATVSLVIATAIYYHITDWLFMIEAVNLDARVVFTLDELMPLLDALLWIDLWLVFIWTATFAIKLSFLVFFRPLIRAISKKLTYYYWFTVVFTIVAWMFAVVGGFILCPHLGKNAGKWETCLHAMETNQTVKCYPNSPYKLNVGLTALVTFLDIATDAMGKRDRYDMSSSIKFANCCSGQHSSHHTQPESIETKSESSNRHIPLSFYGYDYCGSDPHHWGNSTYIARKKGCGHTLGDLLATI